VVDDDVADATAGGGQWPALHVEGGAVEQFAYLIRSGEGKRRWVINDYKFKDVGNPTMVVVADGNKDNGKNSGDKDDRRTSSAWSNFIVRILFHTLLLLA
jgi:hypothetical protein